MAGLAEPIIDVLIVGAGPTGLTLATSLYAQGISFRIVDQAPDAVHESRALAIQARTLEVLAPFGATPALVASGDRAATLVMHFASRTHEIKLFEEGLGETAYPYLLFLSQAETETILGDRLAQSGVVIERGTTVRDLAQGPETVTSTLSTGSGELRIESRFVVGCDGAHSAVRHASGIGFSGMAFPQTFVIADLEAVNLEVGRLHVYLAEDGMLFFFPLGSPATWRMLVMVPPGEGTETPTLDSVQAIVHRYTHDPVVLHGAVWLTNFTVQSRRADRFRAGRVFLAGDAAHIHSPAGAQGMNTGIQDAVNLAWKLAFVCRGLASPALLDSYDRERVPVARAVLRMTNRAFRIATSANPILRSFRPRAAALAVPIAIRSGVLRRIGFRVISQLGIRYRRSPLSVEGRPRLRRGPRAGDRFPDFVILVNGTPTTSHRLLLPSAFQLVLCGSVDDWVGCADVPGIRPGMVEVAYLSRTTGPDVWTDPSDALTGAFGLGRSQPAQFLIRPDGYIGYRSGGTDLNGLVSYLHGL
jgi:2-polyprenyl-6-methoxyphenol hydroxylase-like FAD-dependent oxidoreductase